MVRYWYDWKPDECPSSSRKARYSLGVSVDSTSHAWISCAMMRLTRASILKAGCSSSRRTCAIAACSSWITSFIHSSVV